MRLDNVGDASLAMAMPYADSGVRVVIFYDRVSPLLRDHHAPAETILGYVLVHEIDTAEDALLAKFYGPR